MKKAKEATEYQECKAYFEWACLNSLLREHLIKNVNEGKRSKILGYLINLIGMRKGLPDYHLPFANSKYHGLWIEMKRTNASKRTKQPEQDEWLEKLNKLGHYAVYAYGWEDAASITTNYLQNHL